MNAMQKLLKVPVLVMLLLTGVHNAAAEDLLKPTEAFQYVAVDVDGVIEIDWAVADGYYLYKKQLSFASNTSGVVLGDYRLPDGLDHEDEYFGVQEIYRDRFYVSIPYSINGDAPASFELQIKSRGCADQGLCFLPQTWTTSVTLGADAGSVSGSNKFGLSGVAGAMGEFLPVDEAFHPYAEPIDGNTVEVSFQIADGYYLYKDKITANSKSSQIQLGKIDLPKGKTKKDEYFGETEVYFNDVFGKVSLARGTPDATTLDFDLNYQGCAVDGICYAPTTRKMTVSLPAATKVVELPDRPADSAPVSEQDKLAQLITHASLLVVVATFFGAGLLLAFTPCVLPMVPILSGIIAGDGDNVGAVRGFMLALSYVMGMALVYTAAGVAAAAAGLQLQATFNQPWILILFAGLFVVLSFGMFGMFDLQMPSAIQTRLASASGNQKSGTAIGAFVMGALSALIVTACVAPALIAALTVMAQSGDMLRGGMALFAMSLGMGAPLLAVGAAQGKLLPKAGIWMVAIKSAFGFMMLGLAIWMLSRILPGSVTLALWGLLVFISGIFLGGLTTLTVDSSGTQKLGKGFGLLAVVYGIVLLFGSLTGGTNPLQPLASFKISESGAPALQHKVQFQRIKTVEDLDLAIKNAAADGKTVMLDFYADWCVSCIEMEEYTFIDQDVQAALSATVLLQADVTENDEQDQVLLKRFGVFGPPTIIFFSRDGQQLRGHEVVGYMKAPEFAAHIRKAFATSVTMTARTDQEVH